MGPSRLKIRLLAETLAERSKKGAKKGSDGLKQSKLEFKKEPKSSKNSKADSGASTKRRKKGADSDESDIDISDISSEGGGSPVVKSPTRQLTKRAATKVIKYNLDDSDASSEEELKVNDTSNHDRPVNSVLKLDSDSDDEDDLPVVSHANAQTSDMLFDSLIEENESTKTKEKPKPAPEKKTLAVKIDKIMPHKSRGTKRPVKSKSSSASSDSDDIFQKTAKQAAKKTKKMESDSDLEIVDDSPPPQKKNVFGRPKPKYTFSDSDSG